MLLAQRVELGVRARIQTGAVGQVQDVWGRQEPPSLEERDSE